jgi:hypothetical protein
MQTLKFCWTISILHLMFSYTARAILNTFAFSNYLLHSSHAALSLRWRE